MNATILLALADSGFSIVGNKVELADVTTMTLIGEDEDSHVELFEVWEQRCFCCCCTGECRDDGYEFSFEDTLFEGFTEGDLNGSDHAEAW